jgi:hypothetical protein
MALDDIEKAPQFQALVAEAFRNGGFRHAHNLRALSRSVNQLATEGEPLLSLSWDARRQTDDELPEEKAVRFVAGPYWQRMLPGVHLCPKMPGLNKADFFINAEITDGARVYLQIETLNSSLDVVSDRPSGRVFELIGDGTEKMYELPDVPVSSGLMERIGFWVRGERTTTLGDIADHGSPNRDRVRTINASGQLQAEGLSAFSWHFASGTDTWAIDHICVVHDSADVNVLGNTLYAGQIIGVPQSDILLLFRPPSDLSLFTALPGRNFFIYELPKIRIIAIDAYTQDG